jgi:hypothetical protein
MKNLLPLVVLLITPPLVGEMLTGSTPLLMWIFSPLGPVPVITLIALYGGGAVLVRELTLRWGAGG